MSINMIIINKLINMNTEVHEHYNHSIGLTITKDLAYDQLPKEKRFYLNYR